MIVVEGPDGVEVEFPDGTPPDKIKAVMRRHYGGQAPSSPSVRRDIMNAIPTMLPGVSVGKLASIAPSALGFTGGLVGGVPGAALGGMAGEATRQALMDDQIDPGRMVSSGALEGTLRGAGGVLAWGSKVAPHAMRGVGRVLGRPLVKELVPGARAASAVLRIADRTKLVNALSSPRFQEALRRSPQAGAAILQQLFNAAEPDATGG